MSEESVVDHYQYLGLMGACVLITLPLEFAFSARVPWNIPVEDFGFGFAMTTLAILLWRRRLDRARPTTQETAEQP